MIEGDKKNERKKDISTKCDEGENMPSVPSAGKNKPITMLGEIYWTVGVD